MAIPIVLGPAGAQPQPPASLRAQLLALATAASPGLTANLPGILIEDIASTEVAGVAQADAAWVELANSITPYGANAFILNQLGQQAGIEPGQDTNTAVYVVFESNPGQIIPRGFLVGDGVYQYAVADGGIVASGGSTQPLFCVATQPGAWVVPANTVTTVLSSPPPAVTITCTNPLDGTPSPGPETEEDYRYRTLLAGRASAQGMMSFLKTQILKVPGTQKRLVSVAQINGGGWEVIVGGTADPYQIAYAIYRGMDDFNVLVGSTMTISGITNASPGVATTVLNHGLVTGNVITISGSTNAAFNGTYTVGVVPTKKTFSLAVNTTGFGAYTGGGVITPNPRNQVISITDYPDVYAIPFVVSPLQTVSIALTWNTTAINLVSDDAVQALGATGLAAYVNSIATGQPMNLFELQNAFQAAVVSVIPTDLLTRMVFTVQINSVVVSPSAGTGIIAGDPESYFTCDTTDIVITRG